MAADIIQKNCVIGCIDRSSSAIAVCHASAWIAQTLDLPLTLLHMNEKISTSAHHDLRALLQSLSSRYAKLTISLLRSVW
ncbi:hypothetical protein [Providencia rettgeri]|uniref:hypothetical protein n=1 Tax=Providencia rettgeri TaxID=587 RepID=UPI00244D1B37|nr:hypothetical protein [Providencia rettgeri]MDH2379750.1 hypothetical protein [Providencia rettgeri]